MNYDLALLLFRSTLIPQLLSLSEEENQRLILAASAPFCPGKMERALLFTLSVNEKVNPKAIASIKPSDLDVVKVNYSLFLLLLEEQYYIHLL